MVPSILSVSSQGGGAAGGEFVRLEAAGAGAQLEVLFGAAPALVRSVFRNGPTTIIELTTPPHDPGDAIVTLRNLDDAGAPIAGESTSLPTAFRFSRAPLSVESDLTRLVRALLHALRGQVIANASTPVSLEYSEKVSSVIPIARVPSLTVLGPELRENRLYSTNEPGSRIVRGAWGLEIERLRPPVTVDLRFVLEVVTNSTAEHLELFVGLVNFFHRNPYLTLVRNPADPSSALVRFELASDGEIRTSLGLETEPRGRKDDRRAFEWALIIRGFPIDEFVVVGRSREAASGVDVRTKPLPEAP
jgi:hypothetical protein